MFAAAAESGAQTHPDGEIQELSPQNGLTQNSTMADAPGPRHYPVDLPDLPLSRYEHRGLTARDILVHRIMSKVVFPGSSQATVRSLTTYSAHPTGFASVKAEDHSLGADLQLLRKMLNTTSVLEPVPSDLPIRGPVVPISDIYQALVDKFRDKRSGYPHGVPHDEVQHGPRRAPATLEELALDLVQRHYFEQSDPSLMIWLQARRPRLGAFSEALHRIQPHTSDRRQSNRDGFVKTFLDRFEVSRQREAKQWLDEDSSHLQFLRAHSNTAQANFLFNGGVFLPSLRQSILANSHVRYPYQLGSLVVHTQEEICMLFECTFHKQWMLLPAWERRLQLAGLFNSEPPAADRLVLRRKGRRLDSENSDKLWSARCWGGDALVGWAPKPRRRASSEPPPGSFTSSGLPSLDSFAGNAVSADLLFPRMSLAAMDRRSRRRSLSRTRIAEMFDWKMILEKPLSRATATPSSCANCLSEHHITSRCPNSCGYCGAPGPKSSNTYFVLYGQSPGAGQHGNPHVAPDCPVAAHHRCKCGPFPTHHVAAKCPVTCSRPCGNTHPPGSFKHRNAMGCESRCCMCGIKGHSGSQCKLKKCRCGEHHLGQDCRWKPECRVPGCTRYLCGIHCGNCGREKGKGGLVEGKCEDCFQQSSGSSAPPGSGEARGMKSTRKRGRPRKRSEKPSEPEKKADDGPSWLPLRPRVDAKTKI